MSCIINKLTFNISKEVLNKMLKPINTVNRRTYKTIKVSKCTNCMYNNQKSNEIVNLYCSTYCTNKYEYIYIPVISKQLTIKRIKNTIPLKINKRYRIDLLNLKLPCKEYVEKRLTHTQALQLLAYYYLSDSKGFIKQVHKKTISNLIKCTTKTIDNNNSILQKLGFICVGNNSLHNGYISINICNYKNQHSSNGKGFYVFSSELFKTLCKIKNVNSFRLLLKAILNDDMNRLLKRENIFSSQALENIWPTYMKSGYYKDKVIDDISNINDLAVTSYGNNLMVVIPKKLDGKTLRDVNTKKYKEEFLYMIDESIKNNEIKIDEKHNKDIVNDLIQLSLQYGFNLVKDFYYEYGCDNSLNNICGYIRIQIESYMRAYSTSLFNNIA